MLSWCGLGTFSLNIQRPQWYKEARAEEKTPSYNNEQFFGSNALKLKRLIHWTKATILGTPRR
eukprot:9067254-Pyramimonas_sp.AAC.1